MESISVNSQKCDELTHVLRGFGIPHDEEDTQIEGLDAAATASFYFLLVAICHQTQELEGHVGGAYFRGWDYLRLKLLNKIQSDSSLLSSDQWRSVTEDALHDLFECDVKGPTLSFVDRRAELIRDLGEILQSSSFSSVHDMYTKLNGRLSGDNGLLAHLSTFQAYGDPVQKKSYFFLGLMKNTGCWEYPDLDNLGPPVDYHEVRGHIRLGTVQLPEALRTQILSGSPVSQDSDVKIRASVAEAINRTASQLGITPMCCHYLFWNLFRNICRRQNPMCDEISSDCGLPERYSEFVGDGKCPLRSICNSAEADVRPVEHVFSTDWY